MKNVKGVTLVEWQEQEALPDGFANSDFSYRHWQQGNPLGWAIYCWKKVVS